MVSCRSHRTSPIIIVSFQILCVILHLSHSLQFVVGLSSPPPPAPSSPTSRPNNNHLFDLSHRTALITGGGTGIGSALALGLAQAGAKVVLVGRRPTPLQETAAKINSKLNVSANKEPIAFAVPGDVLDFVNIPSIVSQAQDLTQTPVTILLNNAGLNVRKPAEELTPEHWNISQNLMVVAPFYLAMACSKNFQNENYGRIINTASLTSYQTFPNCIPYSVAKSGLLGLTRGLAQHFSPSNGYDNVTCNGIGPGYVETDLTAPVFADTTRAQKLAEATIIGRNSVPDDLVGTAIWLASEASSYVTAQTIMVDGGFGSLGMR